MLYSLRTVSLISANPLSQPQALLVQGLVGPQVLQNDPNVVRHAALAAGFQAQLGVQVARHDVSGHGHQLARLGTHLAPQQAHDHGQVPEGEGQRGQTAGQDPGAAFDFWRFLGFHQGVKQQVRLGREVFAPFFVSLLQALNLAHVQHALLLQQGQAGGGGLLPVVHGFDKRWGGRGGVLTHPVVGIQGLHLLVHVIPLLAPLGDMHGFRFGHGQFGLNVPQHGLHGMQVLQTGHAVLLGFLAFFPKRQLLLGVQQAHAQAGHQQAQSQRPNQDLHGGRGSHGHVADLHSKKTKKGRPSETGSHAGQQKHCKA